MKTIAVVTIPMGFNNDPFIYDKISSNIKEILSDYAVLINSSLEVKEITIKFFSPELQEGKYKDNLSGGVSVVIDKTELERTINRVKRINS